MTTDEKAKFDALLKKLEALRSMHDQLGAALVECTKEVRQMARGGKFPAPGPATTSKLTPAKTPRPEEAKVDPYFEGIHSRNKPLPNTAPHCPRCGSVMEVKWSKLNNDIFWGCSHFPSCRGIVDCSPQMHITCVCKLGQSNAHCLIGNFVGIHAPGASFTLSGLRAGRDNYVRERLKPSRLNPLSMAKVDAAVDAITLEVTEKHHGAEGVEVALGLMSEGTKRQVIREASRMSGIPESVFALTDARTGHRDEPDDDDGEVPL